MWLFKSYPLNKYDLSWTAFSSLIWYGQKKTTKNNGEEKSTNTENQKHPPVPSITPLFNLLALCVQQIKSEISSDGMLVFFLLNFVCVTFIYLHFWINVVVQKLSTEQI
jgi:hypothetical protein